MMHSSQEKYIFFCFVLTAVSLLSLGYFSRLDLSQIALASGHADISYDAILKEQPDGQITVPTGPEVCWLLSYPNSGTSFTMNMVGQASNTTVATNYGLECDLNGNGENVPVNSSSPHGPYLLHPERLLPKHFILSKTHCGGRCNDCGPSHYLETKESFMDSCAKGARVSSFNLTKSDVTYDPKIAQRAIHLIRNPFNNIVSNFHLERHEKAKNGRTDWLQNYSNNIDGFRHWCRYLDAKYAGEEASERKFSPYTIELFHSIPCHKAFYAFAQWHNLAIRVIDDLHLPSLVVHYESYEKHFNATVKSIFGFLELSPVASIPQFVPGKEYLEYFSPEEIQAAKTLVETISDAQTWKLVSRYFK